MFVKAAQFWKDESGAAVLEFTVAVLTFLLILFGTVEFSFLFYQWNSATKAVQFGARLAAVSDPVSTELATLTGLSSSVLPGDPMPNFYYRCTDVSCTGDGGARNLDALRALVYGRDVNGAPNTECATTPVSIRHIGMCNYFSRITEQNVVVEYSNTGLGYAGRPGGAVPTITVSLTGLTFNYVMLNGLVPGLSATTLPGFRTTMTGEDLKTSGS